MDVHPIKNVSIGIDPYPYVQELAVTGNDLPPPRLETACQTLQGGHFFHVQQALKLARRAAMNLFKRPFCSEAIGCSPTNLAAFRYFKKGCGILYYHLVI